MKRVKLYQGDNIESLKKLPDNSIDSIVSDPPYGLSFMNKKWDYDVPSVDFWREVYRVLKPGGHVLSFGGTRTYHRMVVNIEDAGFEIRDQIMWLYAQGFPKSLNIGKAVDKLQGNEREVVGKRAHRNSDGSDEGYKRPCDEDRIKNGVDVTKGQSPYEGWGTALKPSVEPICVARKPLSEKSVALNVLKWGTGGINIDGCRVGTEIITGRYAGNKDTGFTQDDNRTDDSKGMFAGKTETPEYTTEGRFPANIILECLCDEVIKGESNFKKRPKLNGDDICKDATSYKIGAGVENYDYNDKGDIHTNPMCPCYLMDEQSGVSKSSKSNKVYQNDASNRVVANSAGGQRSPESTYADKGGASRFFYQAKVSKAERNMSGKCSHPTLKPIQLMSYLCKLVTPPGGIILDPFSGSGSTGIAALLNDFRFIGMELEQEYFDIMEKRINDYESYRKFLKK